MARKLIAFLGISARRTRYRFPDDQEFEGEVFPQALVQYLDARNTPVTQALFLVTQEARRKVWPLLAQQDSRFVPVDIDEGRSTLEMWTWLEALLPHIEPQDALVFDITHGLRSAPFLMFLFTAYLRQVRAAELEGIYYGAYDLARGGPAPVMDLSPFARILDWLVATAFFQRMGDARWLAQELRGVAQRHSKKGYLKNAANDLERLSLALMLTRPLEVMRQAQRWNQALARLQQDDLPALRPFRELAAQLQQEYSVWALEAEATEAPAAALQRQYALIRWYVDNNLILQAATLAVEWIVSLVAWRVTRQLVLKRREREEWARAIHEVVRLKSDRLDDAADLSDRANILQTHHADLVDDLHQVWDRLTQVRNDLNHAGMSQSARPVHKFVRVMQQIMQDCERLARYVPDPPPPASSS